MRGSDVVPLAAVPTGKVGYPILTGAVAPNNPVQGMAWLDTSTPPGSLKVYDNGAWVAILAGAATGNYLPLAGGQLDAGAVVDFNDGIILNVNLDEGRY